MGVADEDSYRKILGLAQSTYYKLLGIGSALYMVKLADMERIPVGNAELLMKVDPALWHDFPWVHEAQTLSADEFACKIIQRNRQMGSDAEPTTYYRVKVPYSAKKFLDDTVEKFRQEHNLASTGEALELLIADVHDRPNVMVAIERANRYVKWTMYRCRKKKMVNELQWLNRSWSLLHKAYSAVRMEYDGEIYEDDAKEVYPAEDREELQDFTKWSRDMFAKPVGEDREETPDHVRVPPPAWYLRKVPIIHEPDDDDDSFEE